MTQHAFRDLLTVLVRWATDAYKLQVEFFLANGYECLNPPKPLSDQPTNPSYQPGTRDWKAEAKTRHEANLSDPFYQLGCVADKVLKFPKSLLPAGVTPSEETDELFDILEFVQKSNWNRGRNSTIDRLKRIMELVESILGGKPTEGKEPLGALVSDPQKAPVTATTGVSKRTVELARSVPDGKPVVVLPPAGKLTAEGWCFGEKKLEFPPILKPVLKAYIAGKKDFRRTDCGNLRQRKSELKALIQRAMDEAGYQPVPNRWPKSTKLDGGGVIILFNGRDDENTRTQGAGKTG